MSIEQAFYDIQNNLGNHAKEYYHDNQHVSDIISINTCKYRIIFQNGKSKVVNRVANIEVVYSK
jgi:hypothetical protein